MTENDVELLNWMAIRTDRNSSEWQEIRQASNEPLNDFSTIFRQGHFAANDWKRNDAMQLHPSLNPSLSSQPVNFNRITGSRQHVAHDSCIQQTTSSHGLRTCFPTCRLYIMYGLMQVDWNLSATLNYAYAGLVESLKIMQSCDMSVKAMHGRE